MSREALESIELDQLDNVTGGGKWQTIIKWADRAANAINIAGLATAGYDMVRGVFRPQPTPPTQPTQPAPTTPTTTH